MLSLGLVHSSDFERYDWMSHRDSCLENDLETASIAKWYFKFKLHLRCSRLNSISSSTISNIAFQIETGCNRNQTLSRWVSYCEFKSHSRWSRINSIPSFANLRIRRNYEYVLWYHKGRPSELNHTRNCTRVCIWFISDTLF